MVRVLELFAGIGACSKALSNLDIKHKIIDAVEIDKFAIASFNAIHGTDFKPQDITKWDKDVGRIDLLMHGSPCQDFSFAGLGKGGDEGSGTRSSLMYESLRIIEKVKPHIVIWENVKAVLSRKHRHNFDKYLETMECLGYKNSYEVLNAKDYGIPQNRERVFTVSILENSAYTHNLYQFPPKQPLQKRLKDVLEKEVDESFYLSDEKVAKIKLSIFNQQRARINENEIANTLCARDYKDPQCVKVGDLDIKGHDCNKRVYSPNGVAPTLTTMGGGNCEPKIIAMRGRQQDGEWVQQLESNANGVTNALPSVQKDNMVLEVNSLKRRRTEHGKATRKQYESRKMAHSENMKEYYADQSGIASTLTVQGRERHIVEPPFRIRKLTPKECWRLMGFDDNDYDKASKVNSKTQLYKQAGNSIVVNALEAIIKQLPIK